MESGSLLGVSIRPESVTSCNIVGCIVILIIFACLSCLKGAKINRNSNSIFVQFNCCLHGRLLEI